MHSRHLPPLSTLRAFEAAARHANFKKAAEELGVSPNFVSQQIQILEDSLGIRLLQQTRDFRLTCEAQELYPVLRDGFDGFSVALEKLAKPRGRSALTLAAPTAFATKWLVPRMAGFTSHCPDIDLRLRVCDDAVDFDNGAVDVAIRYGRGPYPNLHVERLFFDLFSPVCSPGLDVEAPADLSAHPLLHSDACHPDGGPPSWALWARAAGICEDDFEAGPRFASEIDALQGAVGGRGVALASLLLADGDLAAGLLKRPFTTVVDGLYYNLVHPRESIKSTEIHALRAWLKRCAP